MAETSKHEIESTRAFRPANAPIQDAVVAEECSGHAHAKAVTPKPLLEPYPHLILGSRSRLPVGDQHQIGGWWPFETALSRVDLNHLPTRLDHE